MRPSLAAVLLIAAPAAAQRVSPPPHPAGDNRTCTALGRDEVCRTVVEDEDGPTGVGRMTRGTATWGVGWGPFVQDFRLIDAGPMRLVATLGAISNGLGVSYWAVDVVPPRAGAPVASFETEDIAPTDPLTETRRGQTVLWATEWWSGPDPAGCRRPGSYLVGRPFRVTPEGLVPAVGIAIRARRLLYDFRAEPGGALAWLRNRRAETWRTDPLLRGHSTTTRGTVTEARLVSDPEHGLSLAVTVRTGAGSALTLTSRKWTDTASFTHVGDGATGRLWPSGYRPADVSAWLVGHRVRVVTYPDRTLDQGVLWRD